MKERTMKTALLLFFVLLVGGCNTMKGLGKDIEKAGETIQRGADNNKKD